MSDVPSDPSSDQTSTPPVQKSDAEWRTQLTPAEYRITRQQGTEPAFTGAYWDAKQQGMYACVCCGQKLYRSDTKFDSGTGWPSFFDAVDPVAVGTHTDTSHGMVRTEIHCNRCGAHLGHIFDDGPAPTGKRHCVNSASLKLIEDAK